MSCSGLTTRPVLNCVESTDATAPVLLRASCVPYPTTTMLLSVAADVASEKSAVVSPLAVTVSPVTESGAKPSRSARTVYLPG